ncbi:MAG: methyltransferase domain-containing protein [Brevinematia bacterium]
MKDKNSLPIRHRLISSYLLKGKGIEIGALNNIFPIKRKSISIKYIDIASKNELIKLFPEINGNIYEPDYVGDIAKNSILEITNTSFDFIILNHVIEHTANPIRVLLNCWEGLKKGGMLVISIPDKRFSYDKNRNLTSFLHLLGEYYLEIEEVSELHYIDFLENLYPEVFESKESFLKAFAHVKRRREHSHVWDSDSFKLFLLKTFSHFREEVNIVFESKGEDNQIEFFCILKKGKVNYRNAALKILYGIYMSRKDLITSFPNAFKNRKGLKEFVQKWVLACGLNKDSDSFILNYYKEEYLSLNNILQR